MALSIYVRGYDSQTTLEDLVIYFQSKESGGGDIDEELCKFEQDEAKIGFDDIEDLQRVLRREHSLHGSKLTVSEKPFKTQPKAKPRKQKNRSNKQPPSAADEKPIVGDIRTIIVNGISPETTDNTLQLFFENKKRSGGGDIEKLERVQQQVAHITFCSSEVASAVLKKESLEVDGYLFQLKAKKPEIVFPADKKKLFIENVNLKTTKDSLTNYVELITGLNVQDLEFGSNKNAMVSLDEEPDMDKVREKAKKRPLEGAFLKITNPRVCNSILVTGLSKETTKDAIELKFENSKYGGGEILDVVYQQDEGKAVIFYFDPNVIHSVTAREHSLNGSTLSTRRYYPCMEENKVAVKNEKKTIPVRPDVMEFVSNSCDQEFMESFGFSISEATYDEENEELTFAIAQPTGRRGKKQMEEIENYLSQFTVKEIHVSRNLLINAKDEVDEKLANTMENFKNKVHATTDNDKLCILVTGKKKKLGKFEKAIQKELNELEKKKEVITMNISLDQHKLMLILSLGFEEQFESYSNIEVKIDPHNGILNLKGSQEMVHSAKLQALETFSKIKEEYVELSERQVDYLASGGLQKVNDSLRKSKVQALVCLDKSKPKKAKVELFDLEKFDNVKGYLSQQVSEKCFTVEEESVHLLKNDKWRKFRETLGKDSGIKVFTVGNAEVSIWLTGETKQVEEAYENLKSFMKINTIISESVVVNHGVSRHLTKCCENKIRNVEKRLEEHLVKVYFKEDRTFLISGTKEGVNQAKIMLQDIIDDLAHQKIPVEKPGMRKYLTTTAGRTSLTGIETRYNCTIHLTNDSEQRSMLISSVASPRPSSRLLCSYETPEKILLEVHHADITAHNCDVIVNAANGDLRHVGGLAKMIVDKGGKEIQKDCDDYVKRNGTLFPGQCYSGTPGNLQCKRLIHTVGPRWDNIDRVKHKKVLEFACANTLESAKTYNTIAIPAIGSGIFQVPKDICAKVMVEAALEFSLKSNGKYPLQEIHFVNNDLTTAEVFLNEFKKKFSFKPTFAEKLSKPRSRIKQEKGSSTGRLTDFPEMTGLTPSIEPKRSPSPADSITTNKNTIISVVVGDLSTHQADVLVNTTSENLQLSSNPCSRALSNEAGPILQQKCNEIGRLKVGEVAFTTGGNLLCTAVCHVICTQWNNGQGEKVLRSIIKNCLEKSHSRGMTSIAFPAIGTGILRFPHQITAKICFEESKKFVQKYPNTCVKDIHFVVYHQDQASITAFKQELRNQPEWTQTTSTARSRKDRRKPAAENPSMRKETKTVKNTEISDSRSPRSLPVLTEEEDGEISVYVRDDVKIEVLKGDITKETTHVIAHLSNPGMSMGGGVARAIIKTGGKEIERECEKEKPIIKHSVLLTKAGRLQANYVAHMAAPDRPDPSDIEKCITNCLQEIVKRECKTISFPAIATGQLNMSPEKSAKAMLTAILVFLQISPGSLNTVRIVIHDQEVFRKFSKAIKKFLQGEDEESPGIVRTLINSFLNLWKSDSTSTHIKQEGTSLKSQLFLDIYADKDVTINEVVNTIDKITGEQMKKEPIENELIEMLSEAHVSRITEIGETHNVDVKIEKAINRIIINGHSEDISKVMLQIYSILNEIRMAENDKDTAEMVSKGVQWFWSDTDGSQVQYDVTINSLIEKAYIKSQKSVTFNLEEGKCEIVFDKMEETNLKTHQTTKVIRKDLIAKANVSVPDYWDPQPKDASGKELSLHVVLLDPQRNANHSKEYKNISDSFLATAQNHTIQKIERIQNPSLYKLYALKKQSMDERDGSNEKLLYHGTAANNVSMINQNGLNRSYTGSANGTAYGRGIYFATNARMSVGYAKADGSGNRKMYVAKVAVGQFTTGAQSMIVPPPRSGNINYDSVVNDVTSPTIFVLFYDNQYYPEYLITFR